VPNLKINDASRNQRRSIDTKSTTDIFSSHQKVVNNEAPEVY